MTHKALLKKGEAIISKTDLEIEAAKLLLLHFSNLTPSAFYLAFETEAPLEVENAFIKAIYQYVDDLIPPQHIMGYSTFYGYDFIVNKDVLIPRRETEELVEKVLFYYDDHFAGKKIDLCDIGTGSGCIGITLKKEEPNLCVTLTDISKEALAVAKQNAEKIGADVTILEGDLMLPLEGKKFDIIVSNPPYIPNHEDVAAIVKKHEPNVALFGGDSGLIFYERILLQSKSFIKDKTLLAFEHAYNQKENIRDLILHYYPNAVISQYKDLSGKDRMTLAEVALI